MEKAQICEFLLKKIKSWLPYLKKWMMSHLFQSICNENTCRDMAKMCPHEDLNKIAESVWRVHTADYIISKTIYISKRRWAQNEFIYKKSTAIMTHIKIFSIITYVWEIILQQMCIFVLKWGSKIDLYCWNKQKVYMFKKCLVWCLFVCVFSKNNNI